MAKLESYDLALDDLLTDVEAKINTDTRNFYHLLQVLKDHLLLERICRAGQKKR